MEVIEKTITYQEFREMEFDEDNNFQYELLSGSLLRKSSPTIQHQRITRNISFAIQKFLEKEKPGEVFFAPLDIVFDNYNVLQPDVVFVGKDKAHILNEEEQVITGVPDLVVDVLSPGSLKKDRVDKKAIYERFKVQEFWIVDPSYKSIEVYILKVEQYELSAFVEGIGSVTSSVLKDFTLPLTDVF